MDSVQREAKADLKEAIVSLAELREQIETEKIPLARRVSILEGKARKLRGELEHYLRLRDNREASLLQLEKEVKESEADLDYSINLFNDYISSWHHGNPPAEQELWSPQLSPLLLDPQKKATREESLDSFFRATLLSIEAISLSAGGISFSGDAIVPPEGTREDGTFWSIGPTIFFSGINGSAGFLERSFSSIQSQNLSLSSQSVLSSEPARLVPASTSTSDLINQAIQIESANQEVVILAMDPTLGKALVMEKGELSVFEELQKGGIWIYPILFFAVLSFIIAVVKAFQIIKVKLPKKVASLEGNYSGPFELLRKTSKGYQGKNPEILEEILYEAIIDMQVKLEKALPLIAVTAATAPLLGLLGTVTGMIDVFRQITNFANPENSELARGISEALVTTKFGLVTAIPSLIAHALLTRRLQGIISKMEGFSARLVRLKQENLEQHSEDSSDDSNS
ncbi:MAG: MotA/TolQ/ExbB proton channel family protein [Opitutales bacterium]|nr:MotA/TolQ/ExbB proton channel family protein [Opitutales bacterium]